MRHIISYFAQRRLLVNVVFFFCLFLGLFLWQKIPKEEMPEFAMNWLRINIRYPGASAEDVEFLITKPVEEKLKGISNLEEVISTSTFGSSSFRITFNLNKEDEQELIQKIKDSVEQTQLPNEIEDPIYSRFTSSEKAILDIALFDKNNKILDISSREKLQKYALAFEQKVVEINEISGFNRQGYLKPEIKIAIDPLKLKKYNISLSEIKKQIQIQNIRIPVGSLKDEKETEISIASELYSLDSFKNLVVRGNFNGKKIYLKQLAHIRYDFAKNNTILKAQGHEAIIYNIKKNASADIISAQKALMSFISRFEKENAGSSLQIVTADDESYDVKNRLSLIGYNGLIGFFLIIFILFIFLDLKSGIWVALGIPFTLAFTLICSLFLGYSVNNMTLASIIIVLGIVVDDAIIVAENIARYKEKGLSQFKAVTEGTRNVIQPVTASVMTTCIAFLPLYFFSGRFGLLIKYIPPIIFMMLIASLLESFLLLPGHIYSPKASNKIKKNNFSHIEKLYERILEFLLRRKFLIILLFLAISYHSFHMFNKNFKFVMFPREESKEISVRVTGPEHLNRFEMAKFVEPLENIFVEDKKIVKAVLTRIGQNRRGGEVTENKANIRVEILPADERSQSLKSLIKKWKEKSEKLSSFKSIKFMKSRWGSESGSPIEIEIRENNDQTRDAVSYALKEKLEAHSQISLAEIDQPPKKEEYQVFLKHLEISKLGVDPSQLAQNLRTFVEGNILFRINNHEEEVDVRLVGSDTHKTSMKDILNLTTNNKHSYLVPYKKLVTIESRKKPANIERINFKRAGKIFADFKDSPTITPLELADDFEKNIFPDLLKTSPTTILAFRGEIEESRQSQSDFSFSIIIVTVLIYLLLVLLYQSLSLPLIIACVVPFGLSGVIYAFYLHDMTNYGFFALIGTLGMIGVIVNDAIVMVSKLEEEKSSNNIAQVASTRLRPVIITTLTTVAGLFPTAYGLAGYDSMLAEMMLAMGWGLVFATFITLIFLPCIYQVYTQIVWIFQKGSNHEY